MTQTLPLARLIGLALPFTAAYLLSELIRNINAVLAPALRADFGLTPSALGLMTAAFLAALGGAQLVVGPALDRFGPRRVLLATLGLAVLGALLFALAQSPAMLVLARFLIGLGLSACWTGAYKANTLWWPRERLPLVNALTIAVAGLGALAATAPAEWLLGLIGWRAMFLGLAALAAGVALWIAVAVPATVGNTGPQATTRVFLHPAVRAILPASALCQGAWIAYQGLWAGVWLREALGLAPERAAAILMGLALAVILGQFAFGLLADRLARDDRRLYRLTFALTAAFIAAQFALALGAAPAQGPLWALYGLFTAGPILSYALLVRLLPPAVSGRAIALLNLGALLSGVLLQGGLGTVIEALQARGWPPAQAQTAPFLAIALLQAAALLNMGLRRPATL